METQLSRWGNSLGLRIPKGIACEAGLMAGDVVDVATSQAGFVVRKVQVKPKYSLEELVSQITEENRHTETDWGEPKGKEIW